MRKIHYHIENTGKNCLCDKYSFPGGVGGMTVLHIFYFNALQLIFSIFDGTNYSIVDACF